MNVVMLPPPAEPAKLEIRKLDGKYSCIVKFAGILVTAVLDQDKLSPSKSFIKLGDYYSDQLRSAWYPIDAIEVVEVLKKVDRDEDAPKPRRWWQKLFRLSLTVE